MQKNLLLDGLVILGILGGLVSCKPDPEPTTQDDMPEWYYTGGKLGTTTNLTSMTFRQPTPATEEAGLGTMFAQGDQIAEKPIVTNTE